MPISEHLFVFLDKQIERGGAQHVAGGGVGDGDGGVGQAMGLYTFLFQWRPIIVAQWGLLVCGVWQVLLVMVGSRVQGEVDLVSGMVQRLFFGNGREKVVGEHVEKVGG